MNPHLGIGTDLRLEAAKEARVLAVDEDVHVTAQMPLLVEHTVADPGMLARESIDHFGGGHPQVDRKRQLDYVAAAGPFAKR